MQKSSSTIPAEPAVGEELRALVQQAQSGDPSVLPRIRELLDDDQELCDYARDLSAIVDRIWKSVMGADDPAAIEALERMVVAIRAELAEYQPTRLEQMLVAQVIANWQEIRYLGHIASDAGQSTFQSICADRLDAANQGYDAARKQLMTLRQLVPHTPVPNTGMRLFDPEPLAGRGDLPWRSCLEDI